MGLGISLTAKSNLGTTPIATVNYVLSLNYPFTFGQFTFMLSMIFLFIEVALMRKDFPRQQYAQVLVVPAFGLFVDLGMYLLSWVNPDFYPVQVITLLIACVVLALGIYLQVAADVLINPGEGVVKVIAEKTGIKFGNVKIMFDSTLAIIGIILSLGFFGTIKGVREGTVISAILVGYFVKAYEAAFRNIINAYQPADSVEDEIREAETRTG